MKHMALILRSLLVLVALLPGMVAAQTAQDRPAQVLLIASDPQDVRAQALRQFLEQNYPVSVRVTNIEGYEPLIDERAHDGFVYFGQDYNLPPDAGLLADLSATQKPLLWINYHGWMLDSEAQARLGIAMTDDHDMSLTKANFKGLQPLPATDTSQVTPRLPARVLYWLFNDDLSVSLPGAVVSQNVTYLSYLPTLAEDDPSFPAFQAAVDTRFAEIIAKAPAPRPLRARLAVAKADAFRANVHLPYVLEAANGEIITYSSDSQHARLLRIRDAGADWVTISRTFFQQGKTGSHPEAHEFGTASLRDLENITSDAHALGLMVRLSIILNLTEESRGPNDWRGFIQPRDSDAWWQTYRDLVLTTARFAKNAGIESLNVGTELNRMQVDADRWRALIADVRDEVGYQGLVGYQVNFDGFETMTWADALDYLAIAAYWPLAETRGPDLATLTESWDRVGADLAAWRALNPGVALEFGEIGYVSQPYTATFPFSWKPNRSRQFDVHEQLTCYLALEQFIRATPSIVGVGLFASTQFDTEPGDIGYSPFGKPAEEVAQRLLTLR